MIFDWYYASLGIRKKDGERSCWMTVGELWEIRIRVERKFEEKNTRNGFKEDWNELNAKNDGELNEEK